MAEALNDEIDPFVEFTRAVAPLIGRAPCRVMFGTAWHFSLDWGEEVQRWPSPDREYRLLVSGSWRLDAKEGTLCTWREFQREDPRGIMSLGNLRVTRIELTAPSDLRVDFEEDVTLRVFSDRECSFIFFSPERSFGVDDACSLQVGDVDPPGTGQPDLFERVLKEKTRIQGR